MAQQLQSHPIVLRIAQRSGTGIPTSSSDAPFDAGWLRQLCLDAGADDVGFVAIAFRRHQAATLGLTYHFTFTGAEPVEATVVIRQGTLHVQSGLVGSANHPYHGG